MKSCFYIVAYVFSFHCQTKKMEEGWGGNPSRSNLEGLIFLGCIYIRAKVNEKAMSLSICYIVTIVCVCTTAMCDRQKIKEKKSLSRSLSL